MPNNIPFTKMQGLGNDYVYVNGFETPIDQPHELAVRISDRHFGVGSDGLVLILPSDVADVRMRMFNADGTEAEMCGNASRCVGKYVHDHGIVNKPCISLETLAGIKLIQVQCGDDGLVQTATVDMGEPCLVPGDIPLDPQHPSLRGMPAEGPCMALPIEVGSTPYRLTAVSMGNPHAIVFVDDVDDLDLPKLGPLFENHPLFPRRTNTEFVHVLSRNRVRMRVWERGAGETLACGTGACAVTVACVLNGLTDRAIDLGLLGGNLHVEWNGQNNHVFMTGPAVTVFEGNYPD